MTRSAPSEFEVYVADEQTAIDVDLDRLRAAVESILSDAGIRIAEISLALVDDPTLHRLNREFLKHDYPTDVLSFVLERGEDSLEGEVVVSTDFAARSAAEYGWPPADEVLLYVIHGTLHLVGYDDLKPELEAEMRDRERHYLEQFGLAPRY
jgi:probable rRNA maturation factor